MTYKTNLNPKQLKVMNNVLRLLGKEECDIFLENNYVKYNGIKITLYALQEMRNGEDMYDNAIRNLNAYVADTKSIALSPRDFMKLIYDKLIEALPPFSRVWIWNDDNATVRGQFVSQWIYVRSLFRGHVLKCQCMDGKWYELDQLTTLSSICNE